MSGPVLLLLLLYMAIERAEPGCMRYVCVCVCAFCCLLVSPFSLPFPSRLVELAVAGAAVDPFPTDVLVKGGRYILPRLVSATVHTIGCIYTNPNEKK